MVRVVGAPLVGALMEGRHEACPYDSQYPEDSPPMILANALVGIHRIQSYSTTAMARILKDGTANCT